MSVKALMRNRLVVLETTAGHTYIHTVQRWTIIDLLPDISGVCRMAHSLLTASAVDLLLLQVDAGACTYVRVSGGDTLSGNLDNYGSQWLIYYNTYL